MMERKAGDKVKIKSLDWYNKQLKNEHGDIPCGHSIFIPQMKEYCGKTATIAQIFYYGYKLDGDMQDYIWTDEMFEDEPPMEEPKERGAVDWEQRRYEIVKDIVVRQAISEDIKLRDFVSTNKNWVVKEAVLLADEIISNLTN